MTGFYEKAVTFIKCGKKLALFMKVQAILFSKKHTNTHRHNAFVKRAYSKLKYLDLHYSYKLKLNLYFATVIVTSHKKKFVN